MEECEKHRLEELLRVSAVETEALRDNNLSLQRFGLIGI